MNVSDHHSSKRDLSSKRGTSNETTTARSGQLSKNNIADIEAYHTDHNENNASDNLDDEMTSTVVMWKCLGPEDTAPPVTKKRIIGVNSGSSFVADRQDLPSSSAGMGETAGRFCISPDRLTSSGMVAKDRQAGADTKLASPRQFRGPPFQGQSDAFHVEDNSSTTSEDTVTTPQKRIPPPACQAPRPSKKENKLPGTGRPPHRQAAISAMSKLSEQPISEPGGTTAVSRKRKAEEDSETDFTSKRQARSQDQPKSRKKVAFKNGLPQSWGDVSKIRMLKPIADCADFDVTGEQIRAEFAELCRPDEPQDQAASFWVAKANRRFETGFVDFLAFQMIYGHAIVPKHFPERPTLGRWVQEVRQWKSCSNNERLTPSRLRRLSEAGFVWSAAAHPDFRIVMGTAKQCDELWDERFQMLVEYKAKNGHCNVPKEDLYENVPGVSSLL
jgi:Helicase associated domain